MSLRYAALALLSAQPMTGYELVQQFDVTVGLMWAASHSQIYPELRRMESEGLVAATILPRGQRAEKRLYDITEQGLTALAQWVGTPQTFTPERDSHRLQIAYGEFTDLVTLEKLLQDHVEYYTWRRGQWQKLLKVIEEATFPIMRARLAKVDEAERRKIVSFKALALRGQVARADTEIEWANQGLELLADLRAAELEHET